MDYVDFVNTLNNMQKVKNNGMGIYCVKVTIAYIRMGMIKEAKQYIRIESDKLWQYPEIRRFIHENFEPIGMIDYGSII
jgi:hypothetical protein